MAKPPTGSDTRPARHQTAADPPTGSQGAASVDLATWDDRITQPPRTVGSAREAPRHRHRTPFLEKNLGKDVQQQAEKTRCQAQIAERRFVLDEQGLRVIAQGPQTGRQFVPKPRQ